MTPFFSYWIQQISNYLVKFLPNFLSPEPQFLDFCLHKPVTQHLLTGPGSHRELPAFGCLPVCHIYSVSCSSECRGNGFPQGPLLIGEFMRTMAKPLCCDIFLCKSWNQEWPQEAVTQRFFLPFPAIPHRDRAPRRHAETSEFHADVFFFVVPVTRLSSWTLQHIIWSALISRSPNAHVGIRTGYMMWPPWK